MRRRGCKVKYDSIIGMIIVWPLVISALIVGVIYKLIRKMNIRAKAKEYLEDRKIFFGVYRDFDVSDIEDAFMAGAEWMLESWIQGHAILAREEFQRDMDKLL